MLAEPDLDDFDRPLFDELAAELAARWRDSFGSRDPLYAEEFVIDQ